MARLHYVLLSVFLKSIQMPFWVFKPISVHGCIFFLACSNLADVCNFVRRNLSCCVVFQPFFAQNRNMSIIVLGGRVEVDLAISKKRCNLWIHCGKVRRIDARASHPRGEHVIGAWPISSRSNQKRREPEDDFCVLRTFDDAQLALCFWCFLGTWR